MIKITKELYFLLKYGRTDNTVPYSIRDIAITLILYIATVIFSIISVAIFFKLIVLEIPNNNFLKYLREKDFTYTIIVGVIFSPVFEEIRHRLCLVYSPFNFALMLGSWTYFTLGFIIEYKDIIGHNNYFGYQIVLFPIIVSVVYLYLRIYKYTNVFLAKFWLTYPKYIFYTFLFSFSLLHIINFSFELRLLIIFPLLTLPQTIGGIFFSYARLKYGIIYSILLHSMNNLFFTFLDFYGK